MRHAWRGPFAVSWVWGVLVAVFVFRALLAALSGLAATWCPLFELRAYLVSCFFAVLCRPIRCQIYHVAFLPGCSCGFPHCVILFCEFLQSDINSGKALENDAPFSGLTAVDEVRENYLQCIDPFIVIDCRRYEGCHVTVSHMGHVSGCGNYMVNAQLHLYRGAQSQRLSDLRLTVLLWPSACRPLSAKHRDTIRSFSSPGYLVMHQS